MSQMPRESATGRGSHTSVSEAEKRASSPSSQNKAHAGAPDRAVKSRSCVICRSRKVRCDKLSPCSNCRRANIACIYPSADRPPRWARRLERPVTGEVMERLHHLEGLVKDLTGQLEQAHAATRSAAGSSHSPGSSTHDHDGGYQGNMHSAGSGSIQNTKFGRLVLNDASKSRYVGSGFWSWVNDELDDLKAETSNIAVGNDGSSDDEEMIYSKTPSTQELGRSPSDRHAFLFRHNLNSSSPSLQEYHPLPSQIPFLINVFSENVNILAQVVHIPTINKMMHNLRGDVSKLTPSNEALMFSIYYAAVTSMEEDDITLNFGVAKSDLNLKYRLGLEHALAKADFLNTPDLVLVQALAIFLFLVRRHDSPRYVWMMTGIVIRMAISLGLQRDGSHFGHLTPFEIEMRRRVWWSLCLIDVRASEDQGTDYTITLGSFDTKMPLNINDADINPESKEMPPEHDSLTDMSISRVNLEICDISKHMVTRISKTANLEEQSHFLDDMFRRLQDGFLRYSKNTESNIMHWTSTVATRIVMGKMTLLVFLPVLFSSPNDDVSQEIRDRLLVAAIEVAEYNHALNSEQACRQWRWVFQTYTHWHAIVYLLLEMSRRPWSPMMERAWVAFHSVWLIPNQSHMNKHLRIWLPLRKLRLKAQHHRDSELTRLRGDQEFAKLLENQYNEMMKPSSSGLCLSEHSSTDSFLLKWRQVIAMPDQMARQGADTHSSSSPAATHNASHLAPESAPISNPVQSFWKSDSTAPSHISEPIASSTQHASSATNPQQWDQGFDSNIIPWLWADDVVPDASIDSIDISMDLDESGSGIDWYNWVETAQGLDSNFASNGPGASD
ncbi:hypothetical protein N7478_001650 [Penicillium angulare]|uniref:uncharacterized protein n=1 Tax=Penicillium angulare TaxID=116970 RepID=UPI002540677B|nr:uncharacterized protein N7478_001650 [Penicillium angulare]KAJ5288620.1 hypothetical protein N7478_001650 [Penicillium angulare]